jgi:hypothetical protein
MMNEFKIEDNVPTPAARGYRKYPFDDMAVGNSFFVGCAQVDSEAEHTRISNAAWRAGHKKGKKFTVRTVEGGIRVWRVA